MTRRSFLRLSFLVPLLCCSLLSYADDQPAVPEGEVTPKPAVLDQRDQRALQNYIRMFRSQAYGYGGQIVMVKDGYPLYESSAQRGEDEMKDKLTKRTERSVGGPFTEVDVSYPARQEVIAACYPLPRLSVGEYGWLTSVYVEKIVGEDEAIVSDIRVIETKYEGSSNATRYRRWASGLNEDYEAKTFRLRGVKTEKMREGFRYRGTRTKGIQVAVMGPDAEHDGVLVGTRSLKRLRAGEFLLAFEAIGIDARTFLDRVREEREWDRDGADERVTTWLRQTAGMQVYEPEPASAPEDMD